MSCKLALQIFSNSVAAAIKTCVATGQLKSKTAVNTADFLKFMNDLFDRCNSEFKYCGNPYNCALSEERPLVEETMRNAVGIIKNI